MADKDNGTEGVGIAAQIKDALRDVIEIYHGYGNVVIEIRAGKVTRIGIEVWTYHSRRVADIKEDGC